MKKLVACLLMVASFGCRAEEVAFNGIEMSDQAAKISVVRKQGVCEIRKKKLDECTVFDATGVAYYVSQGRVVRMEATLGVTRDAALPFGLVLGQGVAEVLRRSVPKGGGQLHIVPASPGFTLIRMIREPRTEYEFELQLHFNERGVLRSAVYKDVL